MAVKKELVNINVRIPRTLKELIDEYIERDLHANLSEFIREALREKIQKDAPYLYEQLFQGASESDR